MSYCGPHFVSWGLLFLLKHCCPYRSSVFSILGWPHLEVFQAVVSGIIKMFIQGYELIFQSTGASNGYSYLQYNFLLNVPKLMSHSSPILTTCCNCPSGVFLQQSISQSNRTCIQGIAIYNSQDMNHHLCIYNCSHIFQSNN